MSSVPSPSTGEEKVLAGVAYLGACILYIPTIVILLIKKDSQFVKFHCFQMLSFILFGIVLAVLNVALMITSKLIPFIGGLIAGIGWLAVLIIWLGLLVYWVILMVKAFQGETMKIPFIGDYIEENLLN